MIWFRWYHGTVTDAKFATIAKRAHVSKALVIATWAAVLESASSNQKSRGTFSASEDEIAVQVDTEIENVEAILKQFRDKKILKGRKVAAFEVRNPKRDNSAERVRKHREKRNASNALQEGDVTHVTQKEKIREDEIREEYYELTRACARTREPEEVPAAEVDQVIQAANDGLRTALGDEFTPIAFATPSRPDVVEWLTRLPVEFVEKVVLESASRYRPNGTHSQISTMAYFIGAVTEAAQRRNTKRTPKPAGRRGRADLQRAATPDYASKATNKPKEVKI